MGRVRRARKPPLFLVGLLAAGGLSACGGTPEAQRNPNPPAAEEALQPASAPVQPARPPVQSLPGLNPLPTRNQLITAVPLGRTDPFGPLPGAGVSPPPSGRPQPRPSQPPLSLPADFRLTGVISSGGRGEAIVEYGTLSGSLRPGDIGGRTTQLLPSGWKVASINVPQERLTLQRGKQRITARLAAL